MSIQHMVSDVLRECVDTVVETIAIDGKRYQPEDMFEQEPVLFSNLDVSACSIDFRYRGGRI
jgi:hypothetical protein